MNKFSFIRKAPIVAIAVAGILFSCEQKDMYDPNYTTEPPIPGLDVPHNFDWKTTSEVQLSVNVNDEYNGKFYYEISVYDQNPLSNTEANLLSKGLAKKDNRFTVVLTLPQNAEVIYVCQSLKMLDGTMQEVVKEVSIESNSLSCDFTNPAEKASVKTKSLAKAALSPSDDIEIPANAIEITGKNFSIRQNNTYVLKEGNKFDGNFNWSDCYNVKIYIEGEFEPQNAQQINNKCYVRVGKTGKYECNKLEINSGAVLENLGEVDIEYIYLTNGDSKLLNYGKLKLDKLAMTSGADFSNYCYAKVDYFDTEGVSPYIGPEALLSCDEIKMNNTTVQLDFNAIFEISDKSHFVWANTITAIDNSSATTALVKFNEMNVQSGGLKLDGNLQALFNSKKKITNITFGSNVNMTNSDESTVSIPPSKCNDGGNNTNEKDPGGSDYPIVVPEGTYTFLIEDNWPIYGDYDMNDLVMDLQVEYDLEDGYVDELEIKGVLRAVGASKSLAAAVMLDKVPANAILKVEEDDDDDNTPRFLDGSIFALNSNGTENGQEYAVIPFFDHAHRAIGIMNERPLTNVHPQGNKKDNVSFEIEIKFDPNKKIRQEDVTISNLNFFVVTDGKTSSRKEVHLAGYRPTAKANSKLFGGNDDNSKFGLSYTSKSNLIWGLMIPSNGKQFLYPQESTNILKAYPKFKEWAISGGTENKDWYNVENAESQYLYK